MIAYLPSPSSGVIHLGPLQLRAYGLAIALGALVGVWLAVRRAVARGLPGGLVESVAVWALPAGIVGARLYHLVTDFSSYRGRRWEMLAIWKGGLGIWGGVALGAAVGVVAARRRGAEPLGLLDVAAPGIAAAQAIGRFGNWFNQELFGRPTTLPWGLRIDPSHRPDRYAGFATFHPTFLYESLWCVLIVVAVHLIERRVALKPGQVFFGYVAMYTVGRWYFETLRIDPATRVGGFRVNELVAPVVLGLAVVAVRVLGRARAAPSTVLELHQTSVERTSTISPPAAAVDPVSGTSTAAPSREDPIDVDAGQRGDQEGVSGVDHQGRGSASTGEVGSPRIGPPAGLMLALIISVILMAVLVSVVLR